VVAAEQVPVLIEEVVRLISPIGIEAIDSAARLIHDLGYHSISLAELGFTLEDLFSLDAVTPEQAMLLRTVGDITALIDQALASSEAQLPEVAEVQALCARYGAQWNPATD
jgi:acyl carrier protein